MDGSDPHPPQPRAGDVPLGVLDLVPVTAGASIAATLRNSVDLARLADRLGYRRYWVTEHHLSPSTAGLSATLLTALIAEATTHLRVGSGSLQLGHRTALSVAEEWGLLDALHPSRLDLGLGRAGWHPPAATPDTRSNDTADGQPPDRQAPADATEPTEPPAPYPRLRSSDLFALHRLLLPRNPLNGADYLDQVLDVLTLFDGTYRAGRLAVDAVPGHRPDIQIWILGRTAGESAEVAGQLGLPYATNYHASPSTTADSVAAYRKAFRPSATLAQPYVIVTADVVVGRDDESARLAAVGHDLWSLANRIGQPAPFPSPEDAAAHQWSPQDRELVADLGRSRLVGTAPDVAAGLRAIQERYLADELLVVTTTFDEADRRRSYELLAAQWRAQPTG
ncbi:LLM class flavin-dependent oxidoreductase [Parafrankia sp. EUN1f]|uniref:LLM class flavin-dependent oxidoreductase n=1 Tax=Parafrankia sp. EUN1f TaxID=102897 RepID=UPI0001C46C82|nr:LLM class flavin-dependent oxidoreductase [Parafrankia sp. EUN1f]EFC80547.1 Luciferase-like monooxygenase [Parafrankia sp. EUN1f]